MSDEFLGDRRQALENEFFHRLNKQKLAELKQKEEQAAKRQELNWASGIDDAALLDKLIELKVSDQSLAAMTLTPLVMVAWADGKMEAKEQEAILTAAKDNGIDESSAAWTLLQSWTEAKPADDLLEAWKGYMRSLLSAMNDEQKASLKSTVLGRARAVAEAAGGFLGLGDKVSDEESQVLRDLESVFA